METRNIAIIAHVDHGKTTLVDAMMRQTGMVDDASTVSMDSNVLERERGITIYAKNASLFYKGTKINIVDTPGHADFSSEVERVLRSIDSVLLLVDAQEGPMPQTKFVLKKSLELGIRPIVILNKIDKPAANPEEVHNLVLELFMDLGASNEQLDFITLYAISKQGIAIRKLDDPRKDLTPLFDTILETIPPAKADTSLPLRMQPFNLGYDNFLGRLAIGRIYEGIVRKGQSVIVKNTEGVARKSTITSVKTFNGFERKEVDQADAGDLVMIAGITDIDIGETICENEEQEALPAISVGEPTISLVFLVNSSPLAGQDGKLVTSRQIRERLERELEINVGLKVNFSSTNDEFVVSGRGELHIAILLENMRREGYEVQVSKPQVILKTIDGVLYEPFEEVTIDVDNDTSGPIIEKLSKRKGVMKEMRPEHGHTRMIFEIPTRGLLGYRSEFITDTRGEGILCSQVIGFRPHVGEIKRRSVGSMVSIGTGKAVAFAIFNLQERGVMYIRPGTEVYEGMVIGDVSKQGVEMLVNPLKGKNLTNTRSSGADEAIQLIPPFDVTLERGLELVGDDEYLEVTPHHIRLRKKYLTEVDRKRKGKA
ncbi:MAG: translational GTPase TypA [Candidatus Gracilibacteria bacterium]